MLYRLEPSPVVALNRAVAIAMRDGPVAGLGIIDEFLARGELANYYLAPSARGELLRRKGDKKEAKRAFERAATLAKQETERRFLTKRLDSLSE